METSVYIPKWLSLVCCQNSAADLNSNSIQTIWVESTFLTASYYKEYLGFRIVFRNPLKRNSQILLKKNRNWVFVRAIDPNKPMNNQRLNLHLHQVDKEYSLLCNKVWIVKPFHFKSKEKFIIKDCNGIKIVYNSN